MSTPTTVMSAPPWSAIPGPPPMPVIGSRGNVMQFIADPIAYMRRLHREYGAIAAMARSPSSMVFGFGAEFNQQILSDAATYLNAGIVHPGPEGSANRRMGFGLLSMNGEPHRRMRRLVSPPFSPRALPGYHPDIIRLTEDMLGRWRVGESRDVWEDIKRLTKLISSTMLVGFDDSDQALRLSRLLEEWQAINISVGSRLFQVDWPGFPYHRMLRLAERLEGELRRIVVERRAHPSDRRGILSILLDTRDEEGRAMTDEELVGQINFLFDASFETTSNSLTWTLFLLSQHPEVAADVHDEITGLLRGQPPAHDQLDQLPLVERVIKESLRLFAPPVYAYRVCSRAVTFGPYDLPKGATVAFSHYMTHHSPELFPEPERFLPKRWETIKPSLYEYLPFGAGAHACLGAAFALMTMQTVLAMLIPRYRLTVVPGARIGRKVLVTLAPKRGMPMRVAAQDRAFAKSRVAVRGNIHEMVQLTVVP